MQGIGEPLPEALLAQSGWARRLARHLVSDTHADDLVQDALEAGLRRPPATDRPLRGWLATVLRHLALNRRAADQRRQAREQRVAADEPTAASPEQALATVQLHRQLGRLIEKLPAEERRVVVLRYFEERSSPEIGALLGVPAATIRWRLGRALDQLRAGLDQEAGGSRRRWVLALAPLVRPGRAVATGPILGIALAGALLVTAAAVVVLATGDRAATTTLAPPAPLARPASTAAATPGGQRGLLAAAIGPAACPAALQRARAEAQTIENELRQYEDPALYFERAAPSAALDALYRPLLADLLAPDSGAVLECREGICRLLFVHHPDVDWKIPDGPWHDRVRDHVARIDGGKVGGITRDPLSGELQQKRALYLRPRLDLQTTTAGSVDCERELAHLERQLAELRTRRERALPPPVQFTREPSINQAATASARAFLDKLAGASARELSVECRGNVCRLTGDPSALPNLHQRPEWDQRYSGLYTGPDSVRFGARYFRIRTPRARTPEETTHDEQWNRLVAAGMAAIKRCAERHSSDERAQLSVLLPGPGELNADGVTGKPSFRVKGPSAERSFGRCLREELGAAFASVPLPPNMPRREAQMSLQGVLPPPP